VSKKRNAAWFAGFAPADNPLYAFAAVVEGNSGETIAGGTTAAPVIGDVLEVLLKGYKPPAQEEKAKEEGGQQAAPQEAPAEPAAAEPVEDLTEDLMNPEGAPVAPESAPE
jgi:penicillin-binding protein 2